MAIARRNDRWAQPFVALLVGVLVAANSYAGSPDRSYRFGDDTDETPTIGQPPSSNFGQFTLDSEFDDPAGSDASDLTYTSGPTYFNAGSGGLARPGAAAGSFGLQFNGTSQFLFRTGGALGVPAQGDDNYSTAAGAPGYTNITTRYIEGWVRPTGGAGTRRDIINDSALFSIFIGANNNWGFVNGTTTVNSSTPATLNQWTHVMHRTFGAGGGAALYVNGIAVAATPNGYSTAAQAGNALNLMVGAGGNGLDTSNPTNFFPGQLDDFVVGVVGNNTGQPGGRDYGAFNLATDNPFVQQTLMGVNPGDINRDGSVNNTDVNTFVANWLQPHQVNGVTVGDLNSRAMGDLNLNGIVDIDDAFTLHAALGAAGAGGLDFSLLGRAVPEPNCLVLLVTGLWAMAWRRRKRLA